MILNKTIYFSEDITESNKETSCIIQYDGMVFVSTVQKLHSSCNMDEAFNYPFDHYTCLLKFGSWTSNGFMVNVTNRGQMVDTSNYKVNNEWEFINANISRRDVYYPCCAEPYPDVTISLTFRRNSLHHIVAIALPCLALGLVTIGGFLLPPTSQERMIVAIGSLLGMVMLLQNVPVRSILGKTDIHQVYKVFFENLNMFYS